MGALQKQKTLSRQAAVETPLRARPQLLTELSILNQNCVRNVSQPLSSSLGEVSGPYQEPPGGKTALCLLA